MSGFISDRVSGGEEVTLQLEEVKNKETKEKKIFLMHHISVLDA